MLENVTRHVAALRELGVDNLMLGWTLGGYPSPNLEVYWSEQSWDEMYQPFTEYSVDSQRVSEITVSTSPKK